MLKVISHSAFDLDAVLETLIRTAIELCNATRGVIWLRRGEQLFLAAHVGYPEEWLAAVRDNPFTPAADAQTTSGVAAYTGEIVHVEDAPNDPRFASLAAHKLGDYRAGLAVPLKRDGKVVGVISLSRPEAVLFTPRHVALVQTFADQAVIAIENVRLFEKVEGHKRELAESLEQQTATGDILRAISRSLTDAQPVFDTIAQSAAKLCGAQFCFVDRFDGSLLHFMAHYGLPPEAIETIERTFPTAPGRGSAAARAVSSGAVVQIPDMQPDPDYEMGALADLLGSRSTVAVPMLKDGVPIGVITVDRLEAGDFPDRQVELLKTFADQAVIAIENVRLFDEVQARGRDLTDALEKQTATAEVLKTISSSAFDLDSVLHTLVKSASDLCHSAMGYIYLRKGDVFQPTLQIGWSPEFHEYMRKNSDPPRAWQRRRPRGPDRVRGTDSRCSRRSGIHQHRRAEDRRLPDRPRRSADARRSCNGRLRTRPSYGVAVQRARDRTRANLRGSGGDRHRERPPVRGGAGAQLVNWPRRWSSRRRPARYCE